MSEGDYYGFRKKQLPSAGAQNYAQEIMHFVLFPILWGGVPCGSYGSLSPMHYLATPVGTQTPVQGPGILSGDYRLTALTTDPALRGYGS